MLTDDQLERRQGGRSRGSQQHRFCRHSNYKARQRQLQLNSMDQVLERQKGTMMMLRQRQWKRQLLARC
eukprot:scaffold91793_cov86-Cyclotella_meneghiniana.AAC.2